MLSKNVRVARTNLRASRGRSFLTMLGVIIAVASITSVVSIGNGIKQSISSAARTEGKNTIIIQQPAGSGGNVPVSAALTHQDAVSVSALADVADSAALTPIAGRARGDRTFSGTVLAVDGDLSAVINQSLAYGGFFTDGTTNNMVVLGSTAAEKLFSETVPLGRTLTIGNQQFIVSGILNDATVTPFSNTLNFNNALFVPQSAVAELAPNGASVYEIITKTTNPTQAEARIRAVLAHNHGGQESFSVSAATDSSTQTSAEFQLLGRFVMIAALITLLVSGIGIMNVMLVSVAERMHEIGIRKAVGATNQQILTQFMTEAAVMSITGSVVGVAAAGVFVLFLRLFSTLAPIFDWPVAGLACLAACVFGILFGSVPAMKAARRDPISALRAGE